MSYRHMDSRVPPPTSPKPYTQSPTPYRPGGQSYRPVVVDSYHHDDLASYPPPPPPDSYDFSPQEDFPPPPPPAPPLYGEDDAHTYSNMYGDEAHYARPDTYRPRSGDYGQSSPRSGQVAGESNYANIQINIAPPTPTNKEFGYGGGPNSPTSKFLPKGGQPARPTGAGKTERQTPGPMTPVNVRSEGYNNSSNSPPASQEAEVDALTNLLVKNMTVPSEEEEKVWGMCGRCNNTVAGDTNAFSAMDNIYHIGCFTCVGCECSLQGKSFFAMESKPYCEACYINSLERCSVCSKPITDRLLRATGKPYHPDCFTCVVCGKSLDGIPFTVDATNQIHCIEDFHKKFAPRCCVCQQPIMPGPGQEETVRIVAMDRSFHVGCYRCEDCQAQLSSESEGRGCYPLDDHILCKNCNAKRIQALTTKMSTEL